MKLSLQRWQIQRSSSVLRLNHLSSSVSVVLTPVYLGRSTPSQRQAWSTGQRGTGRAAMSEARQGRREMRREQCGVNRTSENVKAWTQEVKSDKVSRRAALTEAM